MFGTLSKHRLWAAMGFLALGLGACETSRTTRMTSPGIAVVTRTEAVRSWALVEDGERRGWVVLFEDPDAPADPTRKYFSVRNLHHQELGTIDGHGRAWQFVAHERDSRWVTTGTVLDGAREILELGPTTELEEVALREASGP